MSTFVIAEAGSSWRFKEGHRHLEFAFRMIHAAKAAGADAVKFQWTSNPVAMERRRKVPEHAYDVLHYPVQWLQRLYNECARVDVEFMCTVFLPQDVEVIAPLVRRFKVASLECNDEELKAAMERDSVRISTARTDHPYRPVLGMFMKPIYISVGASSMCRSRPAVSALLHCVCAYPAPLEQLCLGVLRPKQLPTSHLSYVGSDYGGLSDHSGDLITGALAVAAGAEIVEVHFRLSTTPKDNPDYPHSLSPEQLAVYVRNVRKAEVMMGDGVKKVQECERPMLAHRVMA